MSSVIDVSDSTFDQMVIQADKPVLVDFWAPWCGPCRMLAPELERLAEELKGQVVVAKINADENPAVSSRYQVRSIPTIILFNRGKNIQTTIGFKGKDQLKRWIRNAV